MNYRGIIDSPFSFLIMIIVKLFISFIFYSFCGWIWEICLCSIESGKLVNRGFLNGPVLPIYGTGAVLIYLLLTKEPLSLLPLFCTGATVAVTLEYFTSVVMEYLFHARWWDYTDRKCNLDGRICLAGFIVFGIFGVVVVRYIQPWLMNKINLIPNKVLIAFASVCGVILVFDTIITTLHALKIKERFDRIYMEIETFKHSYAIEDIKTVYEYYLEHPEYGRKDLREFTKSVLSYQSQRLIKAFPHMKFKEHQELFKHMNEFSDRVKAKRKEIKEKNREDK